MNKNEYLSKLDSLLTVLTYDERKDIMYDYEEHFKAGIVDGKSEEDIAKELGDPQTLASQYITYPTPYEEKNADEKTTESSTSTDKGSARDTSREYSSPYNEEPISITKTSILVFFTVAFGLGLYIAVWGLIVAFYAVGISTAIVALVLFLETVTGNMLPYVSHPFQVVMYPGLGIMTSIFFASLSGLFMVGSIQFTKLWIRLTGKYFAWVNEFIRRR